MLVADYLAGADVVLARPEFPRMEDLNGCRLGVEGGARREDQLQLHIEMTDTGRGMSAATRRLPRF